MPQLWFILIATCTIVVFVLETFWTSIYIWFLNLTSMFECAWGCRAKVGDQRFILLLQSVSDEYVSNPTDTKPYLLIPMNLSFHWSPYLSGFLLWIASPSSYKFHIHNFILIKKKKGVTISFYELMNWIR